MKKILSAFLALMIGVSGVVGCGNGQGSDTASTMTSEAESTDPYEYNYEQGQFGVELVEDLFAPKWMPEPDTENAYSVTETLTSENSVFSDEEVELAVDGFFLEEDAQLSITRMMAPEPIEGASVNAFSFSLSGAEYNGMYEIAIPYDSSIDGEVGAGYFNEETKNWQPVFYEVDEENHRVIISTSHLSTYGAFVIEHEGTRAEMIRSRYFAPYDHLHDYSADYAAIIKESFGDEITPGGKAYDLGKSVVDDWFMYSDALLKLESVVYGSEFLGSLSKAIGNVGLGLSMAQLAVDYSRGNDQAMAVTAFNTARGLAIGRWGVRALKLSMIGVTAINYSLTQLRQQVIGGREDVWHEAYRMYYRDHGRSAVDWYERIKEIQDNVENPNRFEAALDAELNRYTWKFWNESGAVIGDYQVEAMDKGITGYGGLNEDLKEEIADYNKGLILRDTLGTVFRVLEKELREEQFREYQAELANVKEMLNQIVEFEIEEIVADDEEPEYAGYYIQFGPLAEEANVRQWTGRLNDDGYAQTRFTVLAHLNAGAPNEIRLYETLEDVRNENPAHIEEFVVDIPNTRVTIGELIDGDLEGTWQGTTVITEFLLADVDVDQLIEDMEQGEVEGEFAEACEGVGEAVIIGIVELFQSIMHEDIRTTYVFNSTEDEDVYEGTVLMRVSEILDEASDDEMIVRAVVSNGEIRMEQVSDSPEAEDMALIFTGTFDTEDVISGTFSVPLEEPMEHPTSGQMVYDFIAGHWEVEREVE